jgi:hypothetical protein
LVLDVTAIRRQKTIGKACFPVSGIFSTEQLTLASSTARGYLGSGSL